MKYVLYDHINGQLVKIIGIFDSYSSALKYYNDNSEDFTDGYEIECVKYIGWYR